VITFHQTFEGLGLGSRLSTLELPNGRVWQLYLLGAAYALVTPIGMAIGLGVRTTYSPNSPTALLTEGIVDAISAGILLYTGMVQLLAHELLFNPEVRTMPIPHVVFRVISLSLGIALMSLLGKWA
jgi:solute carrier family 39 (zinc transporter), member 1/2/3